MHSPTHLLGEGHLLISSCETVASSFTTVTPPSVISNWTYRSHFTSISCKTFTNIHLNLTLLSVIFQQTKDWKVIFYSFCHHSFFQHCFCVFLLYFISSTETFLQVSLEKKNSISYWNSRGSFRVYACVCVRVCLFEAPSTRREECGDWYNALARRRQANPPLSEKFWSPTYFSEISTVSHSPLINPFDRQVGIAKQIIYRAVLPFKYVSSWLSRNAKS